MTEIIAMCGLVCSACPAYLATRTNNQTELERVAALWREEYNAPHITVESVICDGCLEGDRKCSHCAECGIRACGIEHGVLTCAHCPEYSCERLEGFFEYVPDARATLERVRRSL